MPIYERLRREHTIHGCLSNMSGETTDLLIKNAIVWIMVIFAPARLTHACCTEREQPISNCSFSYNQEIVVCEMRGYADNVIDTCEGNEYNYATDVSGTVKDMTVEYYYTTCSSAYQSHLQASSCHTQCNHGNAAVHLGLNITFKADKRSSKYLEAFSISLRGGFDTTLRCIQFYFGRNKLSNKAAASHYFYYDGFVGLPPGIVYTVYVTALLASREWSNVHTKTISAASETCWKPDLLQHDTPFTLNITLFQDPTYNFKLFDVELGQQTKEIDFNTAELYMIDGKWGTNVTFECQRPTIMTMQERYLIIKPKKCIFCVPNETRIHISAAPPSFRDCPQDDIQYEVKQDGVIEGNTVSGINWTVPTPIFQSNCYTESNSTHIPIRSQFVVGNTTSVTYYVSQYGFVANCTFNVHVKLVKSVSMTLIIGVACGVGFLLTLLIILAYTKKSTGKDTSDASAYVPRAEKYDVFSSISSVEEHGIPLNLIRDYPGSLSSLSSTIVNGSQMKLQSSSEGYISLPTQKHSSSGYMSRTPRNSSQCPPGTGEENSTLLCTINTERNRLDRRNDEGFSDDSRGPDDDAPVSMQYIF